MKIALDNDGMGIGSQVMRCPVCGHECNHLEGIASVMGDDESEEPLTNQVAEDLDWRRDGVVLHYRCEGGCRWRLRIHQHKGEEYVFCEKGWMDLRPAAALVAERAEKEGE